MFLILQHYILIFIVLFDLQLNIYSLDKDKGKRFFL